MYNIKFQKVVVDLLPWFLRSIRMKQWVGVLSFGNKLVWDRFNSFRLEKDYLMNFTGARIYLERYLNELFDPTAKGIVVENLTLPKSVILFNKVEGRDRAFLRNKSELTPAFYFYNKQDYKNEISFRVKLPASLPANRTNKILIGKEVDRFLVAGRKYEIINI